MLVSKKFFLILLVVLAISSYYFLQKKADHNADMVVTNEKVYDGKQMKQILDIKEITTSKNLKYWLNQCLEVKVVTIGLCFRNIGYKNQDLDKQSIVELLEVMLLEGTKNLDSRQFKEFLLEKNIHLSVDANQDNLFIFMKITRDNLDDGIRILGEIIKHPLFAESDLDLAQSKLIQDLEQDLHDEKAVIKEKSMAFLLGNHPYVQTTLQKLKNIKHIKTSDLFEYVNKNFSKSNLLISISGNISEQEVNNYLDKYLGDINDAKIDCKVSKIKNLQLGKNVAYEFDIPQSIIYFSQPSIDRHHEDFYALYMVNSILGGLYFESNLWKEVREKKGLAYYVSTNLLNFDHWNSFVGQTATASANVDKTIQIIKKEWQNLAENGATQEQLDFHKKYLTGSYSLSFGSTSDIVKVMLQYQAIGLSKDYIANRNDIINSLTLSDINKVAKKYLKPEELTFVILGK
jgi:zinc protease